MTRRRLTKVDGAGSQMEVESPAIRPSSQNGDATFQRQSRSASSRVSWSRAAQIQSAGTYGTVYVESRRCLQIAFSCIKVSVHPYPGRSTIAAGRGADLWYKYFSYPKSKAVYNNCRSNILQKKFFLFLIETSQKFRLLL